MRVAKKCGRAVVFMALAGLCLGAGALSAAEKEAAGTTNGLIGHWPMDEGKGYILKDVAEQVGDGEQVGAEWVPLGKGFCLKLGAPFKAGIDLGWPKPGIRENLFVTRAAPADGRAYARISTKNLCAMDKQKKLQNKTVSLWAKPVNGGVADPAGRVENGSAFLVFGGSFLISINSNKWFAKVMSHHGDNTVIMGPPVESDKWTHLALMHDKVFARFYINGKEVSVEDGPCLITNLSLHPTHRLAGDIWISYALGSGGRVPPAFAGYVDELKIYNKALSPDEVKTEFQAGLAAHKE